MVVFIVLWPYFLTTKLRCLQKNNIGHTNPHLLFLGPGHYRVTAASKIIRGHYRKIVDVTGGDYSFSVQFSFFHFFLFRLFHFFYRRLPSYFPLQWTLTVFGKLVQFCLCFCYSVCPVVLCFSVSNFESFGARSALIPVATDSSQALPGESPNVCSLTRGR